jgi:23S rRNA (cytidine1920-2'-O)/16S rRNA (cytidine1409-2'-O)-methyltransferase
MAGQVRIGADNVVAKASQTVTDTDDLHVEQPCPYVSRGAEKLLAAIEAFHPPIEGRVAMDVGASTGGFTDVLLQKGASRVYAVDAGYGQLHYRLRQDPRVICMERTNARHLTSTDIPEPVALMTADVSFISLTKVLPACAALLTEDAWVLVLVKPQFEAERHEVGKGGVVRDPAVQQRCVETVREFAESRLGWCSVGVVKSPITGPKGNQEYIAVFRACSTPHVNTVSAQGRNRTGPDQSKQK